MKFTQIVLFAVLGFAVVHAAAGQVTSASRKIVSEKSEKKDAVKQPRAAGMVVVKDPDGALRAPTAAEAAALQSQGQLGQTAKSSVLQTAPASGVMVTLDPATSNVYSVMTKGPDGKLKMECIAGEKAAENLMKRGAGAIPAPGEIVSEK